MIKKFTKSERERDRERERECVCVCEREKREREDGRETYFLVGSQNLAIEEVVFQNLSVINECLFTDFFFLSERCFLFHQQSSKQHRPPQLHTKRACLLHLQINNYKFLILKYIEGTWQSL